MFSFKNRILKHNKISIHPLQNLKSHPYMSLWTDKAVLCMYLCYVYIIWQISNNTLPEDWWTKRDWTKTCRSWLQSVLWSLLTIFDINVPRPASSLRWSNVYYHYLLDRIVVLWRVQYLQLLPSRNHTIKNISRCCIHRNIV